MAKSKATKKTIINRFKIEKTDDYLIVWRKMNKDSEWIKWQNIPACAIKNFDKIKVKLK